MEGVKSVPVVISGRKGAAIPHRILIWAPMVTCNRATEQKPLYELDEKKDHIHKIMTMTE